VVVELAAYGLLAGLLMEKFQRRVIWSLLAAMAGGRLALLVFLSVAHLTSGGSYSPLGLEAGPLNSLWAVIKLGWPGMALQLIYIPFLFWLAQRYAAGTQAK